jgi:hypothetical protein
MIAVFEPVLQSSIEQLKTSLEDLSYQIVRPQFQLEITPPTDDERGFAIVLSRPSDDYDPTHWQPFLTDYLNAWEGCFFDKPEEAEAAARKAVLQFLDVIESDLTFTRLGQQFIHMGYLEALMLKQYHPPT